MKALLLSFHILGLTVSSYSLAESKVSAEYNIPTTEQSLMEFATVAIPSITVTNNLIEIQMPTDLVPADSYKIAFERSKINTNTFNSFFGQARCLSTTQDKVSCDVSYNKLYSDYLTDNLELTENQIKSMNLSPDETFRKIELARLFAGEPIGKIFLHFSK